MIKLNKTDIRIRPSAVDTFFQCSYQWGKVFLEGTTSIPNSRAAIGTSIHKAAEVFWNAAMKNGDKEDTNFSALTDASMEAWKEEEQKGMQYGDGETSNTCAAEIIKGTETFIEDIVPFSAMPDGVEKFFKVDIGHQLVTELGGTVDYIQGGTIADLKTGKRKASVRNHTTQQSIYRYLAQENGINVQNNLIQNIVLKKVPEGHILGMETNLPQAKHLINTMLDTLDLVLLDMVPVETILRGNPKYYLCSERYCALYNDCPFIKGEVATAEEAHKVKL